MLWMPLPEVNNLGCCRKCVAYSYSGSYHWLLTKATNRHTLHSTGPSRSHLAIIYGKSVLGVFLMGGRGSGRGYWKKNTTPLKTDINKRQAACARRPRLATVSR